MARERAGIEKKGGGGREGVVGARQGGWRAGGGCEEGGEGGGSGEGRGRGKRCTDSAVPCMRNVAVGLRSRRGLAASSSLHVAKSATSSPRPVCRTPRGSPKRLTLSHTHEKRPPLLGGLGWSPTPSAGASGERTRAIAVRENVRTSADVSDPSSTGRLGVRPHETNVGRTFRPRAVCWEGIGEIAGGWGGVVVSGGKGEEEG